MVQEHCYWKYRHDLFGRTASIPPSSAFSLIQDNWTGECLRPRPSRFHFSKTILPPKSGPYKCPQMLHDLLISVSLILWRVQSIKFYLCSLLNSHLTSSLLGPYIILSLRPSLSMSDQVCIFLYCRIERRKILHWMTATIPSFETAQYGTGCTVRLPNPCREEILLSLPDRPSVQIGAGSIYREFGMVALSRGK